MEGLRAQAAAAEHKARDVDARLKRERAALQELQLVALETREAACLAKLQLAQGHCAKAKAACVAADRALVEAQRQVTAAAGIVREAEIARDSARASKQREDERRDNALEPPLQSGQPIYDTYNASIARLRASIAARVAAQDRVVKVTKVREAANGAQLEAEASVKCEQGSWARAHDARMAGALAGGQR